MSNTIKVIINFFIFVMVAGFIVYIIKSVNKDKTTFVETDTVNTFISYYSKVNTIELEDTIEAFAVLNKDIFVLHNDNILKYNSKGIKELSFKTKPEVRDIHLYDNKIFVLYSKMIEVYSLKGDSVFGWNACSDLSDYCAFTIVENFVFVTDASNKNICQYTTDGNFVQFINSPHDFITPSHAFDITHKNDTIYCVNPGRHLIESYTLKGRFIASFGGPGTEAGFFAGCCNPAYISFNSKGDLYTSEKGSPRICRYKNGKFQEVVLNPRLLGGGYHAYEIKNIDNTLWVANHNKIDVYRRKEN
ncbi:hypothetical protein [Plebeiibacterium sediminum]|uniref:NHL repeat-containing protein n=1 Tax=Plebeiibacterium sediminum TaxID=2992112 RepID=A0AAE3SDU7_9BACT|nr:hypothetical protein [Plebeiobacterium sediminum]MCW3785267.1 hypothetical protein [Plebeiobacterium sediminum]